MPALSLLRLPVALITATVLLLSVPAPAAAQTLGTDGKPITNDAGVTFGVEAHRGGKLEWPENSLEAFTHSVAAGFDAIETDIVFTKDGHGVMSHNDRLPSRCTHTGRNIHSMTLAQVSEVRCQDLAGDKVVPIPTFEQLADVLSASTGIELALDIKTFSGQSARGKRTWAAKAISLVTSHGLVSRTSVVSFNWAYVVPTIHAAAPGLYVLALDTGAVNLGRVRLAARLGANGYGTRMKHTTVQLVSYVKARGMDSVPWDVAGAEQRAFTIHSGARRLLFSTDTPTALRDQLVAGDVDLNPVARPTTTTLAAPVTISRATYTANRRQYRTVGTNAVPTDALSMLADVTLSVTVTGGTGTGTLSVGVSSSPLSDSTTVALPNGASTLTMTTPLGSDRRLRIYTTRRVRLTVQVIAYSRLRFA